MKTETSKLYSGVFYIFVPNIIKIDLYNFELYRFKVGPFFETQYCITVTHSTNQQIYLLITKWHNESIKSHVYVMSVSLMHFLGIRALNFTLIFLANKIITATGI